MSYFPEPFPNKNKIQVKLDLPKSVDTSQFAKKDDLANLKQDVGKLDIDE